MLTKPKRRQGSAGQGHGTRDPAAAVYSRQGPLGSEGGLRTTNQAEGRIHCRGHAMSLPQLTAPTQSVLPPRLHQVRREGRKRFLSLYDGKSLDFSSVPW